MNTREPSEENRKAFKYIGEVLNTPKRYVASREEATSMEIRLAQSLQLAIMCLGQMKYMDTVKEAYERSNFVLQQIEKEFE